MDEYIEREALCVEIEKMAIVPEDLYDYGILAGVNAVREALGHIPDADVAPVVHGRWEIKTDDYDCEYAKCSACGEEFYDANEDTIDITFNYCPNCGAHMKDGDGNG